MRPILLCLFLVSTAVSTALADVRDPGNLFSPRAKDEANRIISDIRDVTKGKEVIIEVIPELPANVRGRVNEPNFWENLTANRARDTGVEGIYVLISREPNHVKGAVGQETQRVFSRDDRDQMLQIMLNNFKAGDFDRGLVESMGFVDKTVRANMPAVAGRTQGGGAPAPTPTRTNQRQGLFSGNVCLWIGVAVVAFMVISAFLRRRAAAQQGYGFGGQGGYGQGGYQGGYGPQAGYGQPGYGQGGGGFGRGVLGGLLGGLGGGWLYDKMRGHGGGSDAHAAPPMDPGTGGSPLGHDSSFDAGGGGSWGDSGGGPVESGGGGDFGGGGDVGGGGDF
jgi:uncharacterized protein